AAGRAAREEEAGDGEVALDDPRHVRVLLGRELTHAGHGEAGRPALNRQIAHRAIAELGEGAVAHREQAPGQALAARDREVPGEVEAVAVYAGPPEQVEEVL